MSDDQPPGETPEVALGEALEHIQAWQQTVLDSAPDGTLGAALRDVGQSMREITNSFRIDLPQQFDFKEFLSSLPRTIDLEPQWGDKLLDYLVVSSTVTQKPTDLKVIWPQQIQWFRYTAHGVEQFEPAAPSWFATQVEYFRSVVKMDRGAFVERFGAALGVAVFLIPGPLDDPHLNTLRLLLAIVIVVWSQAPSTK